MITHSLSVGKYRPENKLRSAWCRNSRHPAKGFVRWEMSPVVDYLDGNNYTVAVGARSGAACGDSFG